MIDAVAGAMAWWRDAGLDQDFTDEAVSWLAPPPAAEREPPPVAPVIAAPPPRPAAPQERIGGAVVDWPQDLAAFQSWWLAEPALDAGQVTGRVAPRGNAGAQLMVLVDYPEAEDTARLLSGPRGRLLDAILAALGIAADAVYVASLLPRHMPLPDWAALGDAGLGDLAVHHVALAAPQRVLAFGNHVSSLLGHDPAKNAEPLGQTFRIGGQVMALAAPGLESLLARPRNKAGLWQALLDWQTI